MMDPRDYNSEMIYTFTSYIYWFILLTFYFSVTNLLFYIFLLFFEWDFNNISLFILSLLPAGPSLSALFYCFNKMDKKELLMPTKVFFEGYRKNYKDACKLWLPANLILFILAVDLQYYLLTETIFSNIMFYVFLILTVLFLLILLYAVQINTFFVFSIRDIFRLSIYYVVMNIKVTLGNLGIVLVSLFVASKTNYSILSFSICVIFYLIYLNTKKVLQDVKENFVRTDEK